MRNRRSPWYTVMLSAVALAAGFLPIATAAAATPASIGGIGELRGVYCASAGDCWAVGDAFAKSADLNQMLHWNGKKWS